MKKSVILALCGMLGFTGINSVSASACSNEKLVELKKTASQIQAVYVEEEELIDPSTYLTGEEELEGPLYEPYFKILFSGLNENIYVKVSRDRSDDVIFIRYQDTQAGSYSFDWKELDDVTKFTFEVYSSGVTPCPDEKLYTGYMVVPMKNEMADTLICQDINDFYACQTYITTKMNPTDQYNKIVEYLEKKTKEEEKNKKWYKKVGDFVKNNRVAVLAIPTALIIVGVATVVVKNNRKRVK